MSNRDKIRKPPLVQGRVRIGLLRMAIRLSFLFNTILAYKSIPRAVRTLKSIQALLQKVWDQPRLSKFIRVNGQYYWSFTGPHWPSAIQKNYLWDELNRLEPFVKRKSGLRILYYAITSSCPLTCEHCFEWDRLNKAPKIDTAQMIRQIKDFQQRGVAQIQLTGGEPMVRFDDLVEIVSNISGDSDVWVLTSGYGINEAKVSALKAAGLTGIAFSLDHYEAEKHDDFRGKPGVFEQVIDGAKLAYDHGLVTCFALCATNEFISEENLLRYARLATENGVAFINMIEPSAVGHYANQEVELSRENQEILEKFYFESNFSRQYRELPIVAYPSYQMRKIGCLGGKRIVYVDSSGSINPCPFCHKKGNEDAGEELEAILEKLQSTVCQTFEEVRY